MAIQVDDAWRPLTRSGDVRVLKYSWGPANANALAVKVSGKGWLIVSPPRSATAAIQDEFGTDGVTALLAPNAYHYLGLGAWQRRFPNATSWAPRAAHARIAHKARSAPLASAEELVGELPGIELVFPEGQKSPDLLLCITAASGEVVWWLGDLFSNTTRADQLWPLRLLSRLAGSGPGYRRNSRPELVYVDDRARWLASVARAVTQHPPSVVVPAHGDAVTSDAASRTAAILLP